MIVTVGDLKVDIDPEKYVYYEYDNAVFRALIENDGDWVEDVLHGDQWVPYQGDIAAPVHFGDQIDPKEIADYL